MYNASDRKDIRRAEKDARLAENNRLTYLRAAMSVQAGRTWFHDLLDFCGCFRGDVSFAENQDYFNLGMRNVGLRLFNDITAHCPDDYILMMREANGRRIERDIRDNRSTDAASAGQRSDGTDAGGGDQELGGSAGTGDGYDTADGAEG